MNDRIFAWGRAVARTARPMHAGSLRLFVFVLVSVGVMPAAVVTDKPVVSEKVAPPAQEGGSRLSRVFDSLLPLSLQKNPKAQFNAITEMSPAGKTWRVPTADNPMFYYSSPGQFVQTGWMVAAGEKPPPTAELEEAMKKALAANGYLPIANDNQRPEILIVFSFGSHGTDPVILAEGDEADRLPTSAEELLTFVVRDPTLFRDVFERARFVAGDRFAFDLKKAIDQEINNMRTNQSIQRVSPEAGLPVNPDGGSPFQIFLNSGSGNTMRHFAEMAFHTCYFVVATAYDFKGVEMKQKIPLWRTRMTVNAQGFSMDEILRPLIANAGTYLGRETTEAVVIEKRVSREGRVDIGTPTLVEEAAPGSGRPRDGKK